MVRTAWRYPLCRWFGNASGTSGTCVQTLAWCDAGRGARDCFTEAGAREVNQAIQFPDRESWDDKIMAIRFPVLVNGFQQECLISAECLQHRYGEIALNSGWHCSGNIDGILKTNLKK